MVRSQVILILSAALTVCGSAQAQSAADIAAIAADAERIRANATEIIGSDTISQMRANMEGASKRYADDIQKIQQTTSQQSYDQGIALAKELAGSQYTAAVESGALPPQSPADKDGNTPVRYRIFVTQRMSEAEVKALVEMYAGRTDVSLVLRGMLPGQNMTKLQSYLYRLLQPIKQGMPIPNIDMDPEPFNQLGIDHAPVIARYDDSGAVEVYALGMTSIAWIEEQYQKGGRGNLGAFGPTVPVGEEDMIEVIMKRAQEYDWAKAGAGALDRYWARTEAHTLPRTMKRRTLVLDPTFEVNKTIYAQDGSVIAAAGDRINPLQMIPFNQLLAFFDPGDAEQVAWAKAVVASSERPVMLMASQLRSLDGLEGLGAMSDSVGAQIYQLPKDVRERFNLQSVPTLVRAQGTQFVIEEQLPTDRPKD